MSKVTMLCLLFVIGVIPKAKGETTWWRGGITQDCSPAPDETTMASYVADEKAAGRKVVISETEKWGYFNITSLDGEDVESMKMLTMARSQAKCISGLEAARMNFAFHFALKKLKKDASTLKESEKPALVDEAFTQYNLVTELDISRDEFQKRYSAWSKTFGKSKVGK